MRFWRFHRMSSVCIGSLFLWAPESPRDPPRSQTPSSLVPLTALGGCEACGSIHQNKTKALDPLTDQELMDLGTDKAAKLLVHGHSVQTWGFLRLRLKLCKNIKSGDFWLRYRITLWFPPKIWGALHLNEEITSLAPSHSVLPWVTTGRMWQWGAMVPRCSLGVRRRSLMYR